METNKFYMAWNDYLELATLKEQVKQMNNKAEHSLKVNTNNKGYSIVKPKRSFLKRLFSFFMAVI